MKQWTLVPGEPIVRTELHAQYGGNGRAGISPSNISRNVLIFSALSGLQYGYSDTLHEDGCFHYTGEGQKGSQTFDRGNDAILHHKEKGKAIRLFDGASGTVYYVGEFCVDAKNPYYFSNAPDLDGLMRRVIIFRLRSIGNVHYGHLR